MVGGWTGGGWLDWWWVVGLVVGGWTGGSGGTTQSE